MAIGSATMLFFVPPAPCGPRWALRSGVFDSSALPPAGARLPLKGTLPADPPPIWFQEITPTQLILKGYAAPGGLVPGKVGNQKFHGAGPFIARDEPEHCWKAH